MNDDLKSYRGGFRYDGTVGEAGALTVSGEYYENHSPESGTSQIDGEDITTVLMAGYHVLADYRYTLAGGNVISLKAYYDVTEEGLDGSDPVDTIKTIDVDFHHLFRLSDANEFSWGVTLRQYDYAQDKTGNDLVFDPAHTVEYRYSVFAQDTITLIPETLSIILGIKAEHNEYSGLEYQPTARLLYQASPSTSYWVAASRSLSTPSRATAQMSIYSPHYTLLASPDFQAEELIAFEGGVKAAPVKNLTVDLALFYNLYDSVATTEFQITDAGTYELWTGNKGSVKAYGAELAATWAPIESWRLTLTASTYTATGEVDADSTEEQMDLYASGSVPKYQVGLRSWIDLPYGLSLNAAAYYVDKLTYREVDAYTKVDARLGWRNNTWDVAVVGQNLLKGGQQEESPGRYGSNALIEQSLFFKVVYHQ
jgi:iron complex outermembrane receptor protein